MARPYKKKPLVCYLILEKTARTTKVSAVRKTFPVLAPNQIAVKVSLQLPDGLFKKPAASLVLNVPKSACIVPEIEGKVEKP